VRTPKRRVIAGILLIAPGVAVGLGIGPSGTDELQAFGSVPDFTLVERSGKAVVRADLDGKVWIADFIFTNCAGTCPLMTEQMSALGQILPEEVLLVSFTVDPARDTPMVLASYANRHRADPDRWYFLTGGREELYTLAREGFLLTVDDTMGTGPEPITHSSRFVLVDRSGTIRRFYDGTDPEEVARIADDVRGLLRQR